MNLNPIGNFANVWTTCVHVLGMGTMTEIPKRSGDKTLTISAAKIFTLSGWHDVNVTNTLVTSTFQGNWIPGFSVKGMGFVVMVPKNYKNRKLSISSVRIFSVDKGWINTEASSISDMANCWRVLLKTDATMGLVDGLAYLVEISGEIK